MNASEAMLEILAEAGVRYLFGNPGTTELPLSDALVDHPRIKYILGLQEVPVVAMADGFAQASGTPGVVNVHISCGLGNGMGMLYNAYRAGTPLILTAGQQDRRLKFEEPILWSDMVQVARPWTKWAVEVERAADLPLALRRAVQTALMPPTGPVFLSIPIDVQREVAEFDLSPARPINPQVRPPVGELKRAAEILARAKNPGILAGSRVLESNGVAELVELAEALGAPVLAEAGTTHGRLAFPCTHPLSAPGMPIYSGEIHQRLSEFDVLFVVGADIFRLYVYQEPERAVPAGTRLIHLDQDAWQLGKNYPTEVSLAGNPKMGLAELASLLRTTMTGPQRELAAKRGTERGAAHRKVREQIQARAAAEWSQRPLTPATIMSALAKTLPKNIAVVEEAVTTTGTILERLGAIQDPTGYFGHRGWALGWGLGCGIGVKLAWPERPVLTILGEGASLYGIQGLWTAAAYRIPVTFVICNNAQYQILKFGAQGMALPRATEGRFEGMDIAKPEVDMVSLARSLGVEAHRVTDPDELAARVQESFGREMPILFDVPVTRGGLPRPH
ncbi:MAG TPA: thiamine pyrophosphate-binding protein [Planctomycetaceae bacterium]|jgi:benzoylformate decarboxylase|nr:thiamine pyrophosphate-binding protein [Planctomycetaceae bacterium]